jgi:endonuclease YncB( thermonuclease family)
MSRLDDRIKADLRGFAASVSALAVIAVVAGVAATGAQQAQTVAPARAQQVQTKEQAPAAKAQPRPFGQRLKVDPAAITVEDGDGVIIRWGEKDQEIVRILGIDTPEVRRVEHNLPYDQPFGLEAKAFAQGAFAAASEVELLRSPTLDPYDRTLAYLFINGRNYSVLAIKARFSTETVSHYGDNGLPKEAAEVMAAANEFGSTPLPFEPPHQYRARMRAVTSALKQSGQLPAN